MMLKTWIQLIINNDKKSIKMKTNGSLIELIDNIKQMFFKETK